MLYLFSPSLYFYATVILCGRARLDYKCYQFKFKMIKSKPLVRFTVEAFPDNLKSQKTKMFNMTDC